MEKPADWHRIRAIFCQALEREPAARAAYLDEACRGQQDIRSAVESLLDAGDRDIPEGFLQPPVGGLAAQLIDETALAGMEGGSVGPYRLLKMIAIGGQGTVYLAERSDGAYHKQVAIKIMREGLVAGNARRRFQRELQTLANLEHPHIARFLDAHLTDKGLPYLVMEFIDGMPIDEYCRKHCLPLTDRIALFRQVCGAVHYAHQNLVVHCDLKPANILVTAGGTPKLVDFGISRLLNDGTLSSRPPSVTTTLRFVTPRYASPEQIRAEPITTASDVYSLGVVLYELLTGRHPYPTKNWRPGELERMICERNPTRPSADRQLESEHPTAKLSRRLRGDLDNIVLTAMHKEARRRYGSAEQLSEDLHRHMVGLPVQAQKDTIRYRTAKFILRNKLGTAAAMIVLMALIGGIIGTTMGLRHAQAARTQATRDARRAGLEAKRANAEAEKSTQIASFLRQTFLSIDPEHSGGKVTVRQILDDSAKRITTKLQAQPEVEADIRQILGVTYLNLAAYGPAERELRAALHIFTRHFGDVHSRVAQCLCHLGVLFREKGDYPQAETMFRKALSIERRLPERSRDLSATCETGLGYLLQLRGDYDSAERLYRHALKIYRGPSGETSPKVAEVLNGLGLLFYERGDYTRAESFHREALALRRKLLNENNPAFIESLINLASALDAQGKDNQAEPLYRQALKISFTVYGDRHRIVAHCYNNLAILLQNRGDYKQAESLSRKALAINRALLGDTHADVARNQLNIATTLYLQGKYPQAESLLNESLGTFCKILGNQHPTVATARNNLAVVLMAQEKYNKAESLFRNALAVDRQSFGQKHPCVARDLANLGEVLYKMGRSGSAEKYYQQSLSIRRKTLDGDHPKLAESLFTLGKILHESGRSDEAEPLLRECLEIRRRILPKDNEQIANTQSILGGCLVSLKRYKEAEPLLLLSYRVFNHQYGKTNITTLQTVTRLVDLYTSWHKIDKASAWRDKQVAASHPTSAPAASLASRPRR